MIGRAMIGDDSSQRCSAVVRIARSQSESESSNPHTQPHCMADARVVIATLRVSLHVSAGWAAAITSHASQRVAGANNSGAKSAGAVEELFADTSKGDACRADDPTTRPRPNGQRNLSY
jgi:hypothetical protein